ncbi:MAG: HEAT repeat domain-containing protein [Deltaproteobacteria bacterium]|nr:HEAT repeat domain-containing protein [Deltaproteobacteria bacterium]
MIQELRQLAQDHDPAVRRGALQALGAAGKPSKAAVGLLVRALGDQGTGVRQAVAAEHLHAADALESGDPEERAGAGEEFLPET